MRIGILGGTFDPVHNGHIALAKGALKKLRLDKVIFIPAYIPPHKIKAKISSSRLRLGMLAAAVKSNSRFCISEYEINRKNLSFTVLTLRALRKRFKKAEIFFITGADSLTQLGSWKDAKSILRLAVFVVSKRPGYKFSARRAKGMVMLNVKTADISSTNIRSRVRKGLSIKGMVSPAVGKYISKNKLYRD